MKEDSCGKLDLTGEEEDSSVCRIYDRALAHKCPMVDEVLGAFGQEL